MSHVFSLHRLRHASAFAVTMFLLVATGGVVNAGGLSAIHAPRWKALPSRRLRQRARATLPLLDPES